MDFNQLFEQIWAVKTKFLVVFFVIFTISYLILSAVDFLPEPVEEVEVKAEATMAQNNEQPEFENEGTVTIVEETNVLPLEIKIEKLGKTVTVLNPESRSIADLDNALLNGVVRHPDSATLAQNGNVFILGHSSYLPNVFNPNFQAFNGIQDLVWGDMIEVKSENNVYIYRVEKVYRANAQDITVPIAGEEKLLTIATCNSFGSVDDRYIVEAKQVEVRSL
jgi:LPXTG-site transpeptidase (sortase) family protein